MPGSVLLQFERRYPTYAGNVQNLRRAQNLLHSLHYSGRLNGRFFNPARRTARLPAGGTLDLYMQMQTYMSVYTSRKDDGRNDWSIVEATVSGAERSAIADDRPGRSLARSLSKARPGGLWRGMAEQQKSDWAKYFRLVK